MSFNNDFNNFFPDFSEGNFISPENVKLNEETKKEVMEALKIFLKSMVTFLKVWSFTI